MLATFLIDVAVMLILSSGMMIYFLYLILFVLLYADDTVIFGTDEKDIQKNLDMFFKYSELWHLHINYDKTKIMIFGTRCDQPHLHAW